MGALKHSDRLTRLEESLKLHLVADEKLQMEIAKKLDTLTKSVDDINLSLSKQKGFIAGMVFIISAVWAIIAAVFKYKFGGN